MREGASLLNLNAALCLSGQGGRSCVSVSELQMRVGNNLLSAPLRGKCISLICNSTNRMYVQGEGTRKVAQSMLRQMSDNAPLSLKEGEKERVPAINKHPSQPSLKREGARKVAQPMLRQMSAVASAPLAGEVTGGRRGVNQDKPAIRAYLSGRRSLSSMSVSK